MFISTYSTLLWRLCIRFDSCSPRDHEWRDASLSLFVKLSIPLVPRFAKPLGLLYPEQGWWHLHRICQMRFLKSSVQWQQYYLASEGRKMQSSLSWLPRVSYCSLLSSISPSLSSPSQSTSSCSQWPAEVFVSTIPIRENNRGCVFYILLLQSITLITWSRDLHGPHFFTFASTLLFPSSVPMIHLAISPSSSTHPANWSQRWSVLLVLK